MHLLSRAIDSVLSRFAPLWTQRPAQCDISSCACKRWKAHTHAQRITRRAEIGVSPDLERTREFVIDSKVLRQALAQGIALVPALRFVIEALARLV